MESSPKKILIRSLLTFTIMLFTNIVLSCPQLDKGRSLNSENIDLEYNLTTNTSKFENLKSAEYMDWDCEEIIATGRTIMTAIYAGASILTFEVFVTLGFGVRKLLYNRDQFLRMFGKIVESISCKNRNTNRDIEMGDR